MWYQAPSLHTLCQYGIYWICPTKTDTPVCPWLHPGADLQIALISQQQQSQQKQDLNPLLLAGPLFFNGKRSGYNAWLNVDFGMIVQGKRGSGLQYALNHVIGTRPPLQQG